MISGFSRKLLIVSVLTVLFVLLAGRTASGITTEPPAPTAPPSDPAASQAEVREKLSEGFHQILDFFAQRDFSLLGAWREMRASGDPRFFEKNYPAISQELDKWSSSLSRVDVSEASVGRLDFTFMLEELAPVALDERQPDIRRDNALLTICMVCLMDDLRCDANEFHRFLATVVAEDASSARKAEALHWWRSTDGFIDEGLLETVLASPAGADPEVRAEAARVLFSIGTKRSLQAQRLLAGTAGVAADPSGSQPQIACAAIRHLGRAGFEEASPDLIQALQDPSREVRACAAESLQRLSGRNFGFDAAIDGPSNLEAIARYRAWWQERGTPSSTPGR